MAEHPIDPTSVAGKEFPLSGHADLVVVGAGPAGMAAALEARRLGLEVLLVDEHPVASALIGQDVPFMFGERLGPAVQNKARMLERVVDARPGIEALFEAGVDVRLGVYAWGAFGPAETSRALARPLLGLADDERSWLVSFGQIIVASGARDLGLAFPGWERPGVMGARGFAAALSLYQAFSGRKIVVLGAGALGRTLAEAALEQGIEVSAIVEVARPAASERLTARGVAFYPGHRVVGVSGKAEVEGIRVAPLGDPGAAFEISCDTVVSALDVVPVVEMFDLLCCRIVFRGDRGGFVPDADPEGRTSVPFVYAAGDCAGISDAAIEDAGFARASGKRAARAAARDRGIDVAIPAPAREAPRRDRSETPRQWLAAHLDRLGETMICRCEEVSLENLLGVRPPRYLDYDATKFAGRDLRSLAAEGPLNQDHVKRLTRAGMGACQGRRCREQVHCLMTLQGNLAEESVAMPTWRAPLRPLPLAVLAAADETKEMRRNWVAWFGIRAQWLPHWEKVPEGSDVLDHRVGLWDVSK